MAAIKRTGFGIVEPNHLSAQRTYQIYAQLPAKIDTVTPANTITQLENGQFAKYDYANGEVNFTGEGEWMLVFNEVKIYDVPRESRKDFALQTKDFTDGVMTPRLFKTNVGDIFTTNCLKEAGAKDTETTMEEYAVGDHLIVDDSTNPGFLIKDTQTTPGTWDTTDGMIWKVVKLDNLFGDVSYPAVKIQRIQ